MIDIESDLVDLICEDVGKQGYCVSQNAVPLNILRPLQNFVRERGADDFTSAGVGRGASYQKKMDVRRDRICWIDEHMSAGIEWLRWCDSLRLELNRRLFLGLSYFESHLALYEADAFYKKHVDAFKGQENRKLSLVTYLNEEWWDSEGGELLIYAEDGQRELERVLPQLGTLVLFLSEEFPHEVLPAKKRRASIAGWFRVKGM